MQIWRGMSDITRQMYREATPFHSVCITMAPSKAVPGVVLVGSYKLLEQTWEGGKGSLGKRKLNRWDIDVVRREEHRRKESHTQQFVLSNTFDSPWRFARHEISAHKDFPSQNVLLIELLEMHQQSVSGWKQKKALPF